ncbi:MAG: hypothetical protein ACKV2U_20840 [Bryobacteraceae bacterium]
MVHAMRLRALSYLMLMAMPVQAEVTASPTEIILHSRRGLPYPWYSTTPPADTAITIKGIGVWNISLGGALSTACGGSCFNVVNKIVTIANGRPAVGFGEGTVYLTWRGLGSQDLPVGTHTGALTIGATTIKITLVVEPRNAYDAFVYPPGFPIGCANSDPGYPHADTCAITDERPASTGFSITAAGGSYVDPQFGYKVSRITPSGYNIQYGSVTAFSAGGKYILASNGSGSVNVFDRGNARVAFADLPGVNINSAGWDPMDDDKLWYYTEAKLQYRNLRTGKVTTAADYSSSSGSRPAFKTITMGGTLDITDDGWWAFLEGTTVCAVDLNELSTGNQEVKTFCANVSSFALNNVDFPQITQVDRESGKRYVLLISAPQGLVFSVGSGELNYEYPLILPGAEPHSDVGQDDNGRQIFFWNFPEIYGNKTYLASMQLNKGANMLMPVEAGGGLRLLYPSEPGDLSTDGHFGCTWRGVCVFSPYGNSSGIPAKNITAVIPGTPCRINSKDHGYLSGDSILIGGATGAPSINGVFSVTALGPNTYGLNGHTCFIGYDSRSANSVKNIASAPSKPNRQEIIMARPGSEVRRLAIHRSKIYDNGSDLTGYYQSPRASISRDGRFVAFESNYGIPEQPSVYVVDAGAPITSTRIEVTSAEATATTVALNYNVPTGEGPASILVSESPELTDPILIANDNSSSESRQFVAAGLQGDKDYFYRIHSGRFSATGRFRTVSSSK